VVRQHRQHRLRRLGCKWPSKARWQRWARGRYPGSAAPSAQQLMGAFCAAVESCRQLRTNGQTEARSLWRTPRSHDVVDTNQHARLRDGRRVVPHGTSGALRLRLSGSVTRPGRLMEVRLACGVVCLVCAVPDTARPQQTVIGVDLGGNTLLAATDGLKVLLVSGRGVKAVIQWRNTTLARLQQAQASTTRYSRRCKRLRRRTYQVLGTTKRQVRDATRRDATRRTRPPRPSLRRSPVPPATSASRAMRRPNAPHGCTPSSSARPARPARPARASSSSSWRTRRLAREPSTKPIPRRRVPSAGSGATTAGSPAVRTGAPPAPVMRWAQ